MENSNLLSGFRGKWPTKKGGAKGANIIKLSSSKKRKPQPSVLFWFIFHFSELQSPVIAVD